MTAMLTDSEAQVMVTEWREVNLLRPSTLAAVLTLFLVTTNLNLMVKIIST